MSETEQPRIIKKYPNRRLYDTEKSQYVTLQQIRDLVLDEVPFVVIDQKSEEDITRSILLQIILEQESEANPLFSNDNLERFIRYYNTGAHAGFSDFIGQGMGGALLSQAKVTSVINAYRSRGHFYANVNPLRKANAERGELAIAAGKSPHKSCLRLRGQRQ